MNWFRRLFSRKTATGTSPRVWPGRVKFPQGTVVRCPECRHQVAIAKQDIRMGDRVTADAWQWIQPKPEPGTPRDLKCSNCGASYHRTLYSKNRVAEQLYTTQGWIR